MAAKPLEETAILLTHLSHPSEHRAAQLYTLRSLVIDAVDQMGPQDRWSLQDRTDTLLALRLTDQAFSAAASAPWRKTWQAKVAATAPEERIRPAYLQRLNGPSLRQATRNAFLDEVWNRAQELCLSSLGSGGLHVLRYVAGLTSPPKSIVFNKFAAAFLVDLGRWPVLTRLSIQDFSVEYRVADEADTSFFQGLFYKHELEAVEVHETPHDYVHLFDGVASPSVTHVLSSALTFHQFAAGASSALPNLRQLTLLFNEEHLYDSLHDGRVAQSIRSVVVDQLTLRWQPRPNDFWPPPAMAQDFVLPVVSRGHIRELVFDGFPQDQLTSLLARSSEDALTEIQSVVVYPPV